jgi:hypothetical protein
VRRSAVPLALLIVVTLGAGVVFAVLRIREQEPGVQASPGPTFSPTFTPFTPLTPSPTETATEASPTPTETATEASPTPGETTREPSPEPTETATLGPTEEATEEPGEEPTPLARTGGAAAPWMVAGALLVAAGGALWRLRRPVD